MPGCADEQMDEGRDPRTDGYGDEVDPAQAESGDETDEQRREGEIGPEARRVPQEGPQDGAQ